MPPVFRLASSNICHKMDVTSKTLYKDFAIYEPFIDDEQDKRLKEKAEEIYGNCYNLTLDEFWGVVNGNYELLGDTTNPTVLQVYWIKRFEEFTGELEQLHKRIVIEPTPEQKQAGAGCIKFRPMEAMLLFCRTYFGLHNFGDAGKITIGEYVLAAKDDYNKRRQDSNWNAIQRQKFKERRK